MQSQKILPQHRKTETKKQGCAGSSSKELGSEKGELLPNEAKKIFGLSLSGNVSILRGTDAIRSGRPMINRRQKDRWKCQGPGRAGEREREHETVVKIADEVFNGDRCPL